MATTFLRTISLFFSSVFGIVLLSCFVLAAYLVTTSTGLSGFTSVQEDVSYPYNISINNTSGGDNANVTQVNITLPASFTLTPGTNFTNAPTVTYQNTSTVLSWLNASGLIRDNQTFYFSFNATAATPGNYNISVLVMNATGINITNLTVTVNDTTRPVPAFSGGTDNSSANRSRSHIFINVSYTELFFANITFFLFNTTGLVNQTMYNSSDAITQINITGLPNGNYTYNVTVHDTSQNKNSTPTYTIILDTTAPTGSLSCTPNPVDRTQVVTCTCSGTDERSGVESTTTTANPSTAETGTHQTSCTIVDFAGNVGSASATFQVAGNGGGSNGGSSSSASGSVSWTRTDDQSSQSLVASESAPGVPVTSTLGARERVKVRFSGVDHSVGVVSLTASSVVVEVASTPQRATLAVGTSKDFDITGDGVMDIQVMVRSITNGKADVVVTPLAQPAPAVSAPTSTPTTPVADAAASESPSSSGSSSWWWIVGVIVILCVVVYFVRRK